MKRLSRLDGQEVPWSGRVGRSVGEETCCELVIWAPASVDRSHFETIVSNGASGSCLDLSFFSS